MVFHCGKRPQFIHSTVYRHLGCCQFRAIMNSASGHGYWMSCWVREVYSQCSSIRPNSFPTWANWSTLRPAVDESSRGSSTLATCTYFADKATEAQRGACAASWSVRDSGSCSVTSSPHASCPHGALPPGCGVGWDKQGHVEKRSAGRSQAGYRRLLILGPVRKSR